MNTIHFKSVLKFFTLLVFVLSSCEKKPPSVTTLAVTNIGEETATSGGNIIDEGKEPVVSRGIVWGEEIPTLESNDGFISEGTGTGIFSCTMENLKSNTEYNVRAFGSSKIGVSYGNIQNFSTLSRFATITTLSPFEITSDSVKTGGTITDDGGSDVTERGVYIGTMANPEAMGLRIRAGSGIGSFIITISDLTPSVAYYVRGFAVNERGESLGSTFMFTTKSKVPSGPIIYNPDLIYGTVSDIEGNIYKTIVIGTQTWMADNLRATKYSDGADIPHIADNSEWVSLKTPGYCWYDENPEYKNLTGALYNWYVVETNKICPAGWHVPSDNEWFVLTDYLIGEPVAGSKMKEVGLTHWKTPNDGATNSSGFTALPAGHRLDADGTFHDIGIASPWWSSTEYNIYKPYYRSVYYLNSAVFRGSGSRKEYGFPVRCLKNN
jgi:uncharacterized protein (TIGR02145 family)